MSKNSSNKSTTINQKGFTIVEILILVSIIAFISINTFAGFSLSSTRIKFQNQTNNLKSTLDSSRNLAFQEQNQDIVYSTIITNQSITTIITNNKTNQIDTLQTLDILYPLETPQFYYKPINNLWNKNTLSDQSPITLTYNSQTRKCEISTPNQTNIIKIHIPLYNQQSPTQTPSNHLFISRENCLSEILTKPIPTN